jgi:hypothetical protein
MYADVNEGDLATADGILEDIWPSRDCGPLALTWPLGWQDNLCDAYWLFMFYSLRDTGHLLWAYANTGDPRYLAKLLAILDSFVRYDEARGYNEDTFDNPHAAAYRAMVLTNTLVKLDQQGLVSPDMREGLLSAISRVAVFLSTEKAFESNVNHGFNEAAALLLVAANFPELPRSSEWRGLAIERLRYMLQTNIDPDGVNIENSPYYHIYVLNIVSSIARWAEVYEPGLAESYTVAARKMLRYAAYITQPDGRLPNMGASSPVIVANQDPAVFERLTELDENFAWVYSRCGRGKPPADGAQLFPSSGMYLLRAPLNFDHSKNQTWLSFDAGPYRTEHSHEDALGITLYTQGVTLLPDSGLYVYDDGTCRLRANGRTIASRMSDSECRDYLYFHGSRGHNTVVVDGKDQASAAATPLAHGAAVACKASYAVGKSELYSGVLHVRTVVLVTQGLVLVVDTLTSGEPHRYAQTWHLFPGAQPHVHDAHLDVGNVNDAKVLGIYQGSSERPTLSLYHGASAPMQGWYSSKYGEMLPNDAAEFVHEGPSARFVTMLAAYPYVQEGSVRYGSPSPDSVEAKLCVGTAAYTVTIVREGTSEEAVEIQQGGC